MTDLFSRAQKIWEELPQLLTKFLAALALLVVFILITKYGRKLLRKGFDTYHAHHNEAVHGRTVQTLLMSLFNVLMYFVTALTVLSALGVNVTSLLTVAGFSGVAIGFGCQTLVKDYISGMFLWFEGRYNVGDVVTVAGLTGCIESVTLRTTSLRATNGALYVIPNGEIRTVTTMTSDFRCAVVDVSVAHGQDYRQALNVLSSAMTNLNERLDYISEDPVVKGYISMDGRAATARIECRCAVDRCWELERDIRLEVLEAFRVNNIKP